MSLAGYINLHSTVYIPIFSTADGRVIEAQPLNHPVRTTASLKNWVATAVTEALTLGHHDWQMRLADGERVFHGPGLCGVPVGLRTR